MRWSEMRDEIINLTGSLRVAGGRDRQARPIVIVYTPQHIHSFDKNQLEKSVHYILSIFSDDTRRKGITFVVAAQKSNWRLTRLCVRHLLHGLTDEPAQVIVVRPEAFWDKRVDNCTRSQQTSQPIYIPLSRLTKYIELSQVTAVDLGGSLEYDHENWIEDRVKAERFFRENTETQTELERVTKILTGAKQGVNNAARTMTQTSATYNNTCYMANSLIQEGRNMLDEFGIAKITEVIGQDILDTRNKIDKQLGLARTRLLALHQAWANLQKSIADAKEVTKLEVGVKDVTEWVLNAGEDLLSSHNQVGYDTQSAEQLRREHEALELSCRETYGHYAELLHKIEACSQAGVVIPDDLQAQRDFMDFVIRSFATRLERRRNILISSARFYRLVSEYFQTTSDIYENLVMTPDLEQLDKAHGTLMLLQESQNNIDLLEDALVREGEKLTDLLAMPVKDALGREIRVEYGADILNIREILDMTKARSELFRDNVELQRVTLEQASHIYNYEKDATQAIVWLDDLFEVMLKSHCQVGCNVTEIQNQKSEHETFEETAKGTYDFGSQLLSAALSLRHSCKLCEADNLALTTRLEESWQRLQSAGHHHMTRLRVTAVLHRTLNKHCEELKEMTERVPIVKGEELRQLMVSREALLLEVARMIRLARLLKSRLREPLCPQQMTTPDYNRSAVDAISERVAEVTALAEQLDAALCSYHDIGNISDILESSPSQEDWYGSLDKSTSSTSSGGVGATSQSATAMPSLHHESCTRIAANKTYHSEEDEFVTASDCTCTPPSRSSSFHTASEGEHPFTPVWWPHQVEGCEEVEIVETQSLRLSQEGCTLTKERVTQTRDRLSAEGTGTPEPSSAVAGPSFAHGGPSPPLHPPQPPPPQGEEDPWAIEDHQLRRAAAQDKCRNWLELKVVEVTPSVTQLADTLAEAKELQEAHRTVIQKIKSKKSPVSELADQAQNILETQNTSPQVYSAMTDSLTTVWQNVNNHLELRANILDLNTGYHAYAEAFNRCCDRLETLCESELPVEMEEMRHRLENLKDCQKECLVTLNQALHQGALLIDVMDGLSEQGTLDSRPQHIRLQAQLAKVQVEQWIENLHLRRQILYDKTEKCRIQLEQCLELARITVDLTVLKRLITERTESLLSSVDQLGDAYASSQLLLHEHKKILPEAKDMQEHALKIVKATEEFAAGGHFAGPDAIKEAYSLLELAASYLHHIEQRETTLQSAIDFFNVAQSALIKLDQLEVQLTTGDLGLSCSQLAQLHLNISRSLDEVTQQPLQQGYKLLEEVPAAEGVKRMVERIENKKINLSVQCTAHKEENMKANQMYTSFMDKYDLLNAYITSMEEYVRGVREMGENLSSAKEYLQTYKKNLNDLQTRGTEITALVSTMPSICDTLDPSRGNEVREKGDGLRMKWSALMVLLEKRIKYCTTYVKALDLGTKGISELKAVEKELQEASEQSTIKQGWLSCQQLKVQFDNVASNFIKDSTQMAGEGSLDVEGARQCLNAVTEDIKSRVQRVEQAWEQWESDNQAKERDRQLWTTNMAATNKTVDWVSKLDAQLYPVLNSELHSANQLVNNVEEKLNTVLPEIKRAQQEIQLRINTAEALITKVDLKGSNEGIPVRLKELNNNLHAISAEYQVLLEKLLTFFNSLAQVENRIESLQREHHTVPIPHSLEEAQRQIRDFETTKHTISEMFNMCLIDSGHIVNKIRSQEGNNGEHDIRTVERAVECLRYSWQKICNDRESALNRSETNCKFYIDLEQIHASIDQLSGQLSKRKGRYGDSLSTSLATSQAFSSFENTIELVEDRILKFINSGEDLLGRDGADQVDRELHQLRMKWQSFREQVIETRRLIELSMEFFRLVEEAENWFRDGNRMLLTIAQRSTQVKTPEEASELLQEIQIFLKPGEEAQNRRLEEISKLADQLYGDIKTTSHIKQVKSGSQDMIRSFNQAINDLKRIADKMKSPLPIVEFMETDDIQSTPSSKIESWHSSSKTISQVTNISTHSQLVSSFTVEESSAEGENIKTEEQSLRKSPSPPLKKKKYLAQEILEDEGKEPYFTTPLEDAVIEEGNRLILKCRVEGIPPPEITWEKDGLLIENNPDYQMKYNDGICTLTIEETFAEDSARFTCKANNSAGSAETTCLLTVKESEPEIEQSPPVFITPLSTVTCTERESLELKCLVGGVPLPIVQWFHGETCLDNDAQFMITYNNGEAVLKKEKVKSEDQGEYKCLAINPAGSQSSVAKVSVQRLLESELPVFTLELTNIMARAGQKIKLECEVKGNPLPKLIWTKDEKEIPENLRDIKITTVGGHSSLVITDAFPKDAGVYSVIAKSPAGQVSSVSYVTVKGRLPQESSDTELPSDMEPVKPSVQIHLRDQSVFEGKKVRLDCVIVGAPEPEVIWYHNGQPVKESPEFQLTFHGDRCSLIIQEALLEDAGTYKVVAINSAGEASSQCILNVQAVDKGGVHATREPPSNKMNGTIDKSTEGAPKFIQLLSDMLVVAEDTVTFECIVTGQPSPTVTWALNNKEVQQSERIHMSQDADGHCTLRITNVTSNDKGVYTAKAANQQGECKCFSHLNVKTPLQLGSVQPQTEEKTCPPSFSQLFADVIIPDGGQTKFECIITGKPTPKIKWLFNDQPVSGKNFLVSTSGNRQVLSLPNVTKALAGKITCLAENEAGKATCVAILTVSEPPITSQLPSIDDLNLNESGVFEMKRAVFMESSSSSHFSSTMTATGTEPVVNIQSKTSKSEFASQKVGDKPTVQVESHKTSEYKNIGGMESKEESSVTKSSGLEKSSSGLLIGKRKNSAPKFITPLNGCIVDQGSEILLSAIIEGYPTPDVSWSRNGGVCPQESEISWELGKSQLRIRNVKTQHGGRYSCTASNSMGTATSSADVVVKKSSFPPVIGRRLQARTATVGERVALEIEVTGIPTPTVLWYKDGQQIRQPSSTYRFVAQGNCHSLIIDKVNHIHSGQYGAVASNAAGEARSTADLLVIDPEPIQTSHFETEFKGIESQVGAIDSPRELGLRTVTSSFPVPGGKVLVEESYKSQKHVEMKVHQSSQSVSDIFEVKSKPTKVEFPQFIPPEPQKEEETTECTSTKSALDFFKSIIKENEEDSKKKKEPKQEVIKTSEKKSVEESTQFQKSFGSFEISSADKKWTKEFNINDYQLEPGPLPEMGYIPKSSVAKQKEEMATRVKKLEESHRQLSESEIPSGGVRIFPAQPQESSIKPEKLNPVIEKKVIPNLWEGKKEVLEELIVPKKVEQPGRDEHTVFKQTFEPTIEQSFEPTKTDTGLGVFRPVSFTPSTEVASNENVWTPKIKDEPIHKTQSFLKKDSSFKSTFSSVKPFDTKPSVPAMIERPKSPFPSADGLAMDKLWAHKHTESSLNTVWPPPEFQQTIESETSSFKRESEISNVSEYKTISTNISEPKAVPPPVEIPMHPIYYVAETHTTHSSNLNQISKKSDFFESTQETNVVAERTIHPSEAKKIFDVPTPPPTAPRLLPKKDSFRPTAPIQLTDDLDLHLEPGPPPEIGYATPPPKERKQSYVEMIEQDLEKDLDREPSRRLVGAVRTMPPPKKESSIERQKSVPYEKVEIKTSEKRSSSLTEDFSTRTFPQPQFYRSKIEITTSPKFGTVPRPSKFTKKCTESDYESDLEGAKIKPRWTPWDSDTDELYYRKVKPPEFTHQPKRSRSVQPEPTLPPDEPPLMISTKSFTTTEKQTKQKVESQFKSSVKKTESLSTTQLQAKPASPPKSESPKNKRREPAPPDGYAADTDEPQKIQKQKISSQHTEKTSTFQQSVKQEKKTLPSATIPKDVPITSTLEPFPFKPSASTRPLQVTVPLPSSPSKFKKGEFKESDYESDYETKIPPVWAPSPVLPEMSFRPVHPHLSPAPQPSKSEQTREPTPPSQFDKGPIRPTPQSTYGPSVNAVETSNTMRFAESTSSSHRVVSMQQTTRVVSFDQKKATRQTSLPTKFVPKGEAKWMSDSESETMAKTVAEEKRLQRVEEMRKRFGEKSSQSVVDLKPGEPPTFEYAPPRVPSAASAAGKHLSEMGSAFKTKAQQFVSDIVTDVKQETKQKKAPILKKREDEPEVYREETRLAEHGTKHIDPDTGLIYFKYDFGYEFGLVLPGEGKTKPGEIKKRSIGPPDKRLDDGSIEVPVIHEITNGGGASRKKRQQMMKTVKWDPTSESEMSDGGEEWRKKATNVGYIPPRISIPASPSPASVSPSLSPYTPATHETTGISQWTSGASSPMPLTSPPIVVNAMLHSELPKKPPMFITPLRDIAVVSGQTARFECIVQAEPTPNVIWAKDGRLIEDSLNHEIQFRNGVCRLTIPQAFSYDAGTYTCTATNNLGTQTTTATLQVPGEGRTYISK